MKLNLLPTYVSKEKQAKTAIILSMLVGLAGIVGAVGMILVSRQMRQDARAEADALVPQYVQVASDSKKADAIIETARPVILNINLADAMNKHNTVYPDLYDEIRRYIPSFFRVTAMSAAPLSGESANVTLNGVLQTQQQYADLMVALLRIPNAGPVSRDGYQVVSARVPALNDLDQAGRPLKPGDSPIPDDPEQRLNYYISQGSVSGFDSTGGFGTEPGPRGAMPNWSEIVVSVVVPRNLMTPNPRATLAGSGGGGTTGGTTGGGPGGRGPGGGAD